jgi:hypothetical protein
VDKIAREYPKASPHSVELTHFVGGPCDEHEIVSCIVLGGPTRGWTVVDKLSEAIKLATSRAIRRSPAQGPVSAGQTVRVEGLQARKDLNGELGVALKYVSDTGRWLVRLRNGEGVKIKPDNLAGMDGAHGRVYVFWGDARWSRAQLLGEIARGHWGLCRASVADVSAPVTEMTEDFLREMNHARAGAMVVRAAQQHEEQEEAGEGGGRDRSESLVSLSDAGLSSDVAAATTPAVASDD